jgi:hypothetical protein
MSRLWSLLSSVFLSACSTFGVRGGYEQPPYKIVAQLDAVEVRRYGPRLAAEVTVDRGPGRSAENEAFRLLAGYIFGGNRAREEVAMTAPVAVERKPQQIAMTAPVETVAAGDRLTMRFFLPSRLTLETAPVPDDPRVQLRVVPGETLAVLRFSGLGDGGGVRRAELLRALDGSPWRATGEPVAFFYDPPWTIPFLRRNEVAVPVSPR